VVVAFSFFVFLFPPGQACSTRVDDAGCERVHNFLRIVRLCIIVWQTRNLELEVLRMTLVDVACGCVHDRARSIPREVNLALTLLRSL
jgi:hypothetical protein